ncbi:MAG: purine-nucleoside phosphorylase [Desulfuromonadales bacterium]|nr:purine-nucleoside phosphorylase [Desulfuromonadales bacterium]
MCARYWTFNDSSPARNLVNMLIQDAGSDPIDLAIVLGSGWSHFADCGQLIAEYNYSDWPCFPTDIVAGHAGSLRLIHYLDWRILCFAGRFHCYQGLSAFQASLPIRIASALDCPRILLTCAAGGVNPAYQPGDFMWLDDHVNLLGDNPLKGLKEDIFVDLSHLYHEMLFDPLQVSMKDKGVVLHRGILAAMLGPSYETPAEIRMLASLGVDVVSMSVAHEAIMARYLKMDVAGLSLVANQAAGLAETNLSHADVLAQAELSRAQVHVLIEQLILVWKMTSSN